jgi:hypothetical protein
MQRTLLATALVLALSGTAHADEAALKDEVAQLRAEVAQLRAAVAALRGTAPAPASKPSIAATTTSSTDLPASASANAESPHEASATTLTGYGEIAYNHPFHDAAASQVDLRRAVIGFSHRFDDSTRVIGEFEWEHAVTSADDEGESEVEQLYVEHELNSALGVRAGLMLMPAGLLNERHEPPTYYGVERNFVETRIIPSTWREGGVSIYGNTDSGFAWSAGIVTNVDLSKWDASSAEGRESPLGSIHQELQLANARDPAVFLSGNWQGVPGLLIGGSLYTGKIGQGQDFAGRDARLTFGEAHARWQPGPFDLSAVYARGRISDTEALNLTFVGQPTPVPESFWGGYVQGAWKIWQHDDAAFAPFLRYELVNTAASYAPIPLGLGVPAEDTARVVTVGANWWINANVVFKADLQKFHPTDEDRLDLGMGYMF